jgi:Toprim domain
LSVTNLKNVPIPPNVKKIVLCADYDGTNSISSKAIGSAAKFYQERGLEVKIAYPEKIPGMEKRDFNDVLKHFGIYSIAKSIQNSNSINLQVANDQQTVFTTMFKSMKLNQSDRELSL